MSAKFALHNYSGQPKRFFFVQEDTLDSNSSDVSEEVGHHIMVIDRSGSMYSDLEDMKSTLIKVLTVEEFQNENLLVSVISYSSKGDLTTHISRVSVSEVMDEKNPYLSEIRKMRVTGLTCISQALEEAKSLIKEEETTCISLHSDGYANHYSAYSEQQALKTLIEDYKPLKNVFVNTICYSAWADYRLLSSLANELSGTCIRASNVRQVYKTLHDTSTLLAGRTVSTQVKELEEASYQVFLSKSNRRCFGGARDLTLSGLTPDSDQSVFVYREVSKEEFETSTLPVCGEGAPLDPILAFIKMSLSSGDLTASKFGLVSLRLHQALEKHSKALTNPDLADFAADMETYLFDGIPKEIVKTQSYGMEGGISVLEILSILSEHLDDFTLNLEHFRKNYTHRTVRKVYGKRDSEGNLIEPSLKVHFTDDPKQASVSRFEINRTTANVNMLVSREIELQDQNQNPLKKVAGIKLDLKTHNNYTLVGDGSLNCSHLEIQVSSKKLYRKLQRVGAIEGDFEPGATYTIALEDSPLVDYNANFELGSIFREVLILQSVQKLLSGVLKNTSEKYTSEQIEELKKHYLSANLNLNFPSTNPYTSLEEALSTGVVDVRTSYEVVLGDSEILSVKKLRSANECLQRFFTATLDGGVVKKPTMDLYWNPKVVWGYKKLSARTKITAVDTVMKPIFESFLGLKDSTEFLKVLYTSGGATLVDSVLQVLNKEVETDEAIEILGQMNTLLSNKISTLYAEKICPLVFYIGATGLVPEELGTKAYTAEEFLDEYSSLKLSKAEKEATFFPLTNGNILSVYSKTVYFSPK